MSGEAKLAPSLDELVRTKRILVCCGAGGVGKTTTATALAIAAARAGRRVLALTVDPSKRLSDTLGVAQNLEAPAPPPADRLAAAGISAPGSLEAWMLDPKLIADRLVRRFSRGEAEAERLMQNRVYRQMTRMVAGMQEYTAMEALYGFVQEGRHDLVVLDTPPARNALDFLEGPGKITEFLEGRVFRLFLPDENAGLIARGAAQLVGKALGAALGDDNYRELQSFFAAFAEVFRRGGANAQAMRKALSDPAVTSFVLVTAPTSVAISDVLYFRERAEEMRLPFGGFVLNRSQAREDARAMPDPSLLPEGASEVQRRAYAKLAAMAEVERAEVARDRALLADLSARAGDRGFALALPSLAGGADDIASLVLLASAVVES